MSDKITREVPMESAVFVKTWSNGERQWVKTLVGYKS